MVLTKDIIKIGKEAERDKYRNQCALIMTEIGSILESTQDCRRLKSIELNLKKIKDGPKPYTAEQEIKRNKWRKDNYEKNVAVRLERQKIRRTMLKREGELAATDTVQETMGSDATTGQVSDPVP